MIEIVYVWPNGMEEVRYRRTKEYAGDLIAQVDELKTELGDACPYYYREV